MPAEQPTASESPARARTRLHHRRCDDCHLLWVGEPEPAPEWFDPQWLDGRGLLRGVASGRGTTHFAQLDDREVVLRHYRRGGMFRRVLGDRYPWTGLARSRPWRELDVQQRLYRLGLPVPRPVGARIVRAGGLRSVYRADLLTERVPAADSLTRRLAGAGLEARAWQRIGEVLARFHETGLDHADLNAHNILLDDGGGVWLIDFDRARLRAGPGHWCERNLTRLRRSLDKIARLRPDITFTDTDWGALCDGYEAVLPANRSPSTARSSTR